MRMLCIGGTGFIGRWVVDLLVRMGHEVIVFHRGETLPDFPVGVMRLLGDRRELSRYSDVFRKLKPDVVIDLALFRARDARELIEVFKRVARRAVVISSTDVYRTPGHCVGTERHPMPVLDEDSPIRQTIYPYKGKVLVERAVYRNPDLPTTILRLPSVYGPGDRRHRFLPILKRMDDHRQVILLDEERARWRSSRGYVENVAAAIYLAAVSRRSSGKVYNVAEERAFSERQWVRQIARITRWDGQILEVPRSALPAHLRPDMHTRRPFVVDTMRLRWELGYTEPVSLGEAVARTIQWERANPPAETNPMAFDYAAEDAALAAAV